MWQLIANGFNFLSSLSWAGLLSLFWFTILFDVPRYMFSFLAATLFSPFRKLPEDSELNVGKVSVILAGHNEASGIERCVRSLNEQSLRPDEIIVVSDGSTDAMSEKLQQLRKEGIVDQVHCTILRGGKSAALNLGERYATGDIVIIADCDSTYHRHAIKSIVKPFVDPTVGAVSGNILIGNTAQTLITNFQAIEYLINISLGKQASALADQITCVSGAFGAFRRSALEGVNGVDVGGGEDFDLTLKLRKAGWKVQFTPDAICHTDPPTTLRALIRQRFRWERDTVRLRYRKHIDLVNPFSRNFEPKELFHQIEFFVFDIAGAVILPIYIVWLFLSYGELAVAILLAVQIGLFFFILISFILAALSTPSAKVMHLLPYTLGYSFFSGFVMRHVRLAAYIQEWLFNASAGDEYLPEKVRLTRRW